jgi:plasmid stabilization system protein ParE
MSRRAKLSRRAERDVRTIQNWLVERSRVGALRWLEALEAALDQLPTTAASCPTAPEADDLGLDLRQKLFQTRRGHVYRLVFLIREDTVEVLAVRGTGQDFLTADELELPELTTAG